MRGGVAQDPATTACRRRRRPYPFFAVVASVVALVCVTPAFGDAGAGRVVAAFPAAGTLQIRAVRVRARPDPDAKVVRLMHQFRRDFRRQEIFAVSSRVGSDGQTWYRISVPGRPNGRMGWLPAWAVRLRTTVAKVEVHRRSRRIDLFWRGKRVYHAVVAIGAPGRETPLGHYFVAARFVPYHDPFLGVFAVETSAYSKLTEWPGGGVVGIHGTNMPQLLGQAVSHGCVRVANSTAVKLKRYAPLGTPIWIKRS